MAASLALVGSGPTPRAVEPASLPILIVVPVVTVGSPRRRVCGLAGRRRLRRDRAILALAPLICLVGLVVWGAVRWRPAPSVSPAAAPPPNVPLAATWEILVAEPLPLPEPLEVSAPMLPDAAPVLAVRPSGYLIPDEEPVSTEGSADAEPRR
jgi:hypothetical protein